MKITCQSCQAKYTIADDKVLGKIVKIRCKKCSSTIVVNGADPSGAPAYGASDSAGQGQGGQDEGWTVNVADGDQRTMSDAEVVAAYQDGIVGTETFCWKDGMSDWLPLREIETLYEACNATRMVAASPALEDSATRARAPIAAPVADYVAAAGNGSPNGGAARRAGGRAPGANLFHGAAQAGGEEDVLTSAPAGAQQAYEEQRPTGARNENSVLFSLSALTSKGTDRPPPVPGVEASGLIDIRQLSAQMGRGDDKKRSRVDDIMNLSSGGAFNGTLSAPTLTAPAIDQYGPPAGEAGAGGPKSKALIFLALGAGTFVIVGAIGATMLLMHGKGTDADSASASASAAAASAVPSAIAATTTATASAAAPEATAAASDSSEPAAAPPAASAAATVAAAPVAPAAVAPAPAHVAPAAPAHTAAPAPAPAPAAPAADVPFNMGEAKSKLAAAAAGVQSCKKGDAAGTGRIVVVFAPSGGAQSATLSGPPFDGTPTGSCVSARFRGVHVPAFTGSPFSVSKSFTIN